MCASASGQQAAPPAAQSGPAQAKTANDSAALSPEAARKLFRAEKYKEAAEAYQQLIRAGSATAPVYAGLAWSLLKLEQVDEAAAAAAQAVKLNPSSAEAHTAMGEVLFRLGKIIEAQNEFLPLVRADTDEPRAYLGLARVYLASSYYRHAKLMTDEAFSMDSQDREIQGMHNMWLSLSERIAALEAYLAAKQNQDPQEREEAETRLARLKEQAKWRQRPCRLAGQPGPTQAKLEVLRNGPNEIRGYGLHVTINKASANLTLDTGASGLLLDKSFADKAGAERIAEATEYGIGDQKGARGYLAHVDSIRVGELEFQDCVVHVVEKRSSVIDDGLIGADVFSNFLVEIDYPGLKFKLGELPQVPNEKPLPAALEAISPGVESLHDRYVAPEMKSFSPVFRFGHELLIETRVGHSQLHLFLIDTGSFGNTISPQVAREATKVHEDDSMEIRGLNGKVKNVYSAYGLNIQFAHLQQDQQDMVAFDHSSLSENAGTEIAGILGIRMLCLLDIKIDYRDGLVEFNYDRRRIH